MVVGNIVNFIHDKHAKIKVLAFKRSGNWIFDEDVLKEEFEPSGYVFEDSFSERHSGEFSIGDFILFTHKPNFAATNPGDDKNKIDSVKRKLEYQIIELEDFLVDEFSIDIEWLQKKQSELPSRFYLKNSKGYYGSFKNENGKVIPSTGKQVEFRSQIQSLISFNDKIVVYDNPKPTKILVDASTKKQLQDWFKKLLGKSNNGFFKTIIERSNWKEEFLRISSVNSEIEKSKLNRVINSIEEVEFSLKELQILAGTSEKLTSVLEQKTEAFKAKILESKKSEIEQEIKNSKKEISTLEKQKEKFKAEVEKIIDRKKKLNSEVKYIEENKERLITDFGIFQQLLPSVQHGDVQDVREEKKFFIEGSNPYPSKYATQKSFDEAITAHLSNYGKKSENENFRGTREIIATYKCTLTHSIELALSFIHATNNYKYIISQVEAKWLSFQDLWENGLKVIWESAHASENILHFLILRDVNLSSPECYAGPLLDLDRGFRKKLPYDGKGWPKNLRIIATYLPVPEIGLHIYDSTFNNWGGLPKLELEKINSKAESPKLMLPVEKFLEWSLDIDDVNNYLEDYITE